MSHRGCSLQQKCVLFVDVTYLVLVCQEQLMGVKGPSVLMVKALPPCMRCGLKSHLVPIFSVKKTDVKRKRCI